MATMSPTIDDAVLERARAVLPDAVALRRRIHQHPELGLHLPETQAAVLASLEGLPVQTRLGETLTSVVADLEGGAGAGRTILLRADMDALPMPEDTGLEYSSEVDGAMHACGHDAHTAMLAGAAQILAGMRDGFAGRVRFMFQPGEEGHFGARFMVREGVLDDPMVDSVFALHVAPTAPSGLIASRAGAIMASSDVIRITVTGRGGHASTPFLANDPMPVAAEIITALQVFATRRINTFDPVVISITHVEAGTTNNVIPETVFMEGTLRSVSEGSRSAAREGITRVAGGIAAAHGMEATVDILEGYPVTANDAASVEFVRSVATGLLGPLGFIEMPAPVMGAEDFGYLLRERPGAFAFLGAAPKGGRAHEAHNCHSNRMTLDEDAMVNGMAMYAAVALHFLAQ